MVLQHSRLVSALAIDCHIEVFSRNEAAGCALRPPRVFGSATAAGVAGQAATAVRDAAPLGRTGDAVRQPRFHTGEGRAADRALQIAVGEVAQRFLVQVELAGELLLHDVSPCTALMRAILASTPKKGVVCARVDGVTTSALSSCAETNRR